MHRFKWILILITIVSLSACSSPAGETQLLTLRARDIAFDVTTLEAKANQPIELTYVNEGLIDHAFLIEGLLDEQTMRPGETRTFTFTPTQAGEFKFVCIMPGHEMAGMVGTLTVTQ